MNFEKYFEETILTPARESLKGIYAFYETRNESVSEPASHYAIRDFEAYEENQMSLSEGQGVAIEDDEDDFWWLVSAGQKTGLVPADVIENSSEREARKNKLRNVELSRPASYDMNNYKRSGDKLVKFSEQVELLNYCSTSSSESDLSYKTKKDENKGWISRMLGSTEEKTATYKRKGQILRVHAGNFSVFPCYKTILADGNALIQDLLNVFAVKFMVSDKYEYQMYAICERTGYTMLIDPNCTLSQAQRIAKMWVRRLNTRSISTLFKSSSLSDLNENGLRKLCYHSSESELFIANSETFHFVMHRKLTLNRVPFYLIVQVTISNQHKYVTLNCHSKKRLGDVFQEAVSEAKVAFPGMAFDYKVASPSGKTIDPDLDMKMLQVFELFPSIDYRQLKFIVLVQQQLANFEPKIELDLSVENFDELFVQ